MQETFIAPRWSPDMEMQLLGAAMLSVKAAKLSLTTSEQVYFKPANQEIWRAIRSIVKAGAIPDFALIRDALGSRLQEVGDVDYLIQCAEACHVPANAEYYLARLEELKACRDWLGLAAEMVGLAQASDDDSPITALAEKARQVSKVSVRSRNRLTYDPQDLDIDDVPEGIPTGFHQIDQHVDCSGLPVGQVAIVSALTGIGKTQFMLQLARNILDTTDNRVFFATMADLDAKQLKRRMVKHETGFSKPPRTFDKLEIWKESCRRIGLLDWQIYDGDCEPSGTDIDRFAEEVRLERNRGPFVLIVDYIQEMHCARLARSGKYAEIVECASVLKQLSRELGIATVVGSQLTRKEGGEYVTRYCPELEHKAALSLRIIRERRDDIGRLECHKNRFGYDGWAYGLTWDKQFAKYHIGNDQLTD